MEDPEGIEVYDSAGDYVLGSGDDDDRFAIWDRADPSTPIATFAGDDRGLEQAERLLEQFRRAQAGRRMPKALLIVMVAGLALWIVASLIRQIVAFVDAEVVFGVSQGGPGREKAVQVLGIVQSTAFQVGASPLLLMAALWLYRSLQAGD